MKRTSMWKQELLAGVGLLILVGGVISAIVVFIVNLSPFSTQLTCVLPLVLFLAALMSSVMIIQVMFKSVGHPHEESKFQKNEREGREVL